MTSYEQQVESTRHYRRRTARRAALFSAAIAGVGLGAVVVLAASLFIGTADGTLYAALTVPLILASALYLR